MLTSSPKTLSPAELAKLEHAFAADPSSDAYKPLAEAYLGMSRYMEAMVVCKKGVKAHPQDVDPRVLLARVYSAQGKDRKALEELVAAMQAIPDDKRLLRDAGSLQVKTGETEAGRANLLKAWQIDPSDADTLAAMTAANVQPPKPVAAAPVPEAPPALSSVPTAGPGTAARSAPATPRSGASSRPQFAPASGGPTSGKPVTKAPMRRPAVADDHEPPISEVSEVGARPKRASSRSTQAAFFAMLIGLPLSAGIYYAVTHHRAQTKREVTTLLKTAEEALKDDSYKKYEEARLAAEQALSKDSDRVDAHRYLAYVYTVLWGEHGGGEKVRSEDARSRAEGHLSELGKNADPNSYAYAAEALFKHYSGKSADARTQLADRIKSLEADSRKSSLLYLTLGLIDMGVGDLESAREHLESAKKQAPDDARVFAALGALHRRRGDDQSATVQFTSGLRFNPKHPETKLNLALLVLDQEEPAEGYVSASKYLADLLAEDTHASPRQRSAAQVARALLISRASRDIPLYKNVDFQKKLIDGTKVVPEASSNKQDITRLEKEGFNDATNPDLHIIKGKRLLWEGDVPAASAEIKQAIAMDGSRPHYSVELARAWMRKEGGEKEAEGALRSALLKIPDSSNLLTLLGQVLYRQKRPDDALQQFNKALALTKVGNPDARMFVGRIYKEKSDWPKALESFEAAAKESTRDASLASRAWDEAGLVAEAKGDKAKAEDAFKKALENDRDNDGAHCHLARLLKAGGDVKNKDRVVSHAADYMRLNPRGECSAELAPLAKDAK